MQLFKYENFKVVIEPEAYLVKAFRDIWDRDTTDSKTTALLELGYIYFLCDPRSDFMEFVDEETRSVAIIVLEGLPEEWEPDAIVKNAIEVYKHLSETTSSLALKDCLKAISKVRLFLTNFDLNERDDKLRLIMPINTYTASIKQLNAIAGEVHETEKRIKKEIEEMGRLKGQRDKTLLDDGLTNVAQLMKGK